MPNICFMCKDLGLFIVRNKSNKCTYSFRCDCHRGEVHNNFPLWKSHYAADFEQTYDENEPKEVVKDLMQSLGEKNIEIPDQSNDDDLPF